MRKISMMFAAAALACIVSGASAQDEPKGKRPQQGQGRTGGFGGGAGGGVYSMIGTNKVLQEELKITDDQKTKLETVSKANRDKATEAMKGINFREMTEEQRKEMTEKRTKLAEESKKSVEEVLTSEQKKRASQINYQVMGTRAFADKDVQAALKLTDDQKEKIKGIQEAAQKDMRELLGAGGFRPGGGAPSEEDRKKMEDTRKKTEALRKESEEKIAASLTDEQKKAWKELIGEKFDTTKLIQGFGAPRPRDN